MKNRAAAVIFGLCILLMTGPVNVFAAEPVADSVVFTDGEEAQGNDPSHSFTDGEIDKTVNILKEKAEAEARKYLEEKEAAQKAAEEKAAGEAKRKEEERLAKRQEIVDFALQFEGNPYVYGGTSLTNGADCSGFVMSVFQEFGYELPRVAADQCAASEQKSLEEIELADLVFYGDYGIDHVALYIGDGKVIHASTAATGIKISDYTYRQPTAVGTYLN